MSFKYHRGGWCGPGWSDGKWQRSKRGYYTAVDAFDQTCKEHDIAYDIGTGLKKADFKFYRQNIGQGIKRSAAALGVGGQGYFREADLQTNSIPQNDAVMARSRTRSRSAGSGNLYITPESRGRTRTRSAPGMQTPRRTSFTPTPGTFRVVRPMSLSGRSLSRSRMFTRASVGTQIGGPSNQMSGASIGMGGRVAGRAKSTKKFSRSPRGKIIKSGVSITTEYGAIATATAAQQMIALGHTSVNIAVMQRAFAAALFKKLLYQAGVTVQGWDDPVVLVDQTGTGVVSEAQINFYYTDGVGATAPIVITQYAISSPGTTLDNFVVWFCSIARPWAVPHRATVDDASKFSFIKVNLVQRQFDPLANAAGMSHAQFAAPTTLWLERATCQWDSKSSLKFQNRSTNAVSNGQDDAVDNIPLYGKFYEGSGNGLMPKSSSSAASRVNMYCDPITGVINPSGAIMVTAGYKEPPQPSLFKCTKYGKVSFPPGYVKTSVMTQKKSMGFNTLYRLLFQNWTLDSSPTAGFDKSTLGIYRLFCVEKILQAGSSDSAALNLAYELNYDLYFSMKAGRSVETVARFLSTI